MAGQRANTLRILRFRKPAAWDRGWRSGQQELPSRQELPCADQWLDVTHVAQ